MNFKETDTSSKPYVIALVIAVAVLLFTAGMAYRQIKRMQTSAEMVAHTLQVNNAISELSAHYDQSESEEFREKLSNGTNSTITLDQYKYNGKAIVDSLKALTSDNPSQQERLGPIEELLETLYDQLPLLDVTPTDRNQNVEEASRSRRASINSTLYHIRSIKNEMLAEERRLMQERKADYDTKKYLAPLTSFLLGFFALFVFIISFLRIYKNKQRLRKSEAFLQNILATTNNIVNYYEPIFDEHKKVIDFEIVFANDCNRDYLGLEPKEIIGKTVSKVFPYLTLNGEFEELVRCYKQKEKVNFNRQVAFGGKKMWFHSLVSPLSEGILVTIRNTTQEETAKQKQLSLNERLLVQNEKLTEVRSFLSNVLASTDNIISYFTPIYNDAQDIVDFTMIFNNENIEDVLDEKLTDLENKRMSEVLPVHFKNGVFEIFVDCMATKKTAPFEKEYEFNGKHFWFKTTAVKLDEGILTTSIDTTIEKKAKNNLSILNKQLETQNLQLLDNRAFLTNIFKSISHIVMHFSSIRNKEGQITDFEIKFMNDKINTVRVDISKDFKNKKVSEVFPSILNSKVFGYLVDAIENNRIVEYEIPYQGHNQEQWFYATAIKLGDGVTVTTREVTEEKKNTEQMRLRNLELLRSNSELEAFNRVASHDLQEPLRKIQLFISRITDDKKEKLSDKKQVYFDKIENAAKRMQSLIINLLTYSRIEGKHENFEKINLNDVLAKVNEDLSSIISETKTKIKSEKLPEVNGVPYQLEQLFANLISNSIKYRSNDAMPKINILSEKVNQKQIPEDFFKIEKHYHKITISDNGIGFSPVHTEKIFEVFQRLHQKSEYSGTGIGLAICKKIVENHNGFIYATSQPSVGSAFVFYLPVGA